MKYCLIILCCVLLSVPVLSIGQPVYKGKPKADTAGKVRIEFKPTFNGKRLTIGDEYYVTPHGDTFYIDAFRFYVTNISFDGSRLSKVRDNHLFDLEDSTTWSFWVRKIPEGKYNKLNFTLGVDSIANTSGANSGDLDPAKGMYWAWNSGYIMAKLEGHSKSCKTLHQAFEFHIGGYMPPYNTARNLSFSIPDINIPNIAPTITLYADVAAWFSGDLDLAKLNSIMIPGKDASMMADKYVCMFSVKEVSIAIMMH